MKPTYYFAIAVRLFAIYLFLYGIQRSSFIIEMIAVGASQFSVSWFYSVVLTIAPILFAAYLWFFPLVIAKKIIKPELDQALEAIDPQGMLTILILAMALFFLYNAIIDGVYWVSIWQIIERSDSITSLADENKADMIATGFEFAVSFILLMSAKSLARNLLNLAE